MPSSPQVLFIHGLWLHASSWQPWQALFEQRGHQTLAPGWPGGADSVTATRDDPDAVADRGSRTSRRTTPRSSQGWIGHPS